MIRLISFVVNIVIDVGENITVRSYCIVDVGGVIDVDIEVHVMSTRFKNGFNAKFARIESSTCEHVKSLANIASVAVAGVGVGEYNTLNDEARTLIPGAGIGIGVVVGGFVETTGAAVGSVIGAPVIAIGARAGATLGTGNGKIGTMTGANMGVIVGGIGAVSGADVGTVSGAVRIKTGAIDVIVGANDGAGNRIGTDVDAVGVVTGAFGGITGYDVGAAITGIIAGAVTGIVAGAIAGDIVGAQDI